MIIIKSRSLLFVLALILSACTTNNITGRQQLMLVSEESAIAQSATAYNSLIGGYSNSGKIINDEKINSRIQEITNRLIAQAIQYRPETRNWDWSVKIIDDPQVNAFCMAGGKMAIYTGFIDKVNPTDDEVAQVMGHEVSHALAKHTVEKMSIQLMTGIAVAVATASANPQNRQTTHDASALAALAFITLPNSREEEAEADRIGIELAAKAGYDPHAAVTLWEKMMRVTGQSSRFDFLSTHPASPKRMDALAELEVKMQPYYLATKSNPVKPSENLVTVITSSSDNNASNTQFNLSTSKHNFTGNSLTSSASPNNLQGSVNQNGSVTKRLRVLNALYKDGIIDKNDFESKKKEILDSM